MTEFPQFMQQPANRIASGSQATPGVEGYVFDGADGSQMAFWTCREAATTAPHAHEFDEYMLVVQGCCRRGILHSTRSVTWRRGHGGDQDDPRIWRAQGGPNSGMI